MINLSPNYSIHALISLYLIISANFMVPLFSCDLQSLIIDNIIIRHMIGFLTLLFFVRLTGPGKSSFQNIITDSVILYLWFIASTKITSEFLYIVLSLTAVYFILYIYETTNESENKKDKKVTENIELAKYWISRLLGLIIIIGVILYYGEKRLEYKKDFDLMTFIFGKVKCKKYTPNYTIMDKLSAVL